MTQHSKLIRDKIPDFINTNHGNCQVKELNLYEYQQALKEKLVEESQEVLKAENEANLLEEIADVYEVLEALIATYNLDIQKLQEVKQNKAEIKGKFEKKLLLINTNQDTKKLKITKEEKYILKEAEIFLQQKDAHSIDLDWQVLRKVFLSMNEINSQFFRLKLSKNLGGLAITDLGFYSWQILIAKYSGALSFLQTQHQSSIVFLTQSKNEILKEKYLREIIDKNKFCGVGFSHLRKLGKPSLTAKPVEGGYQLTGFVPWITGYQIFNYFIIGATLPDGKELYGIVPFVAQDNLQFSHPMKLFAMNSTNTITATLTDWFLREEDVVMIKPYQAIHQKDQENVLHHGFFALGCAQGALNLLKENICNLKIEELNRSYEELNREIDDLQSQMLKMVVNQANNFAEKLALRAEAINLAFRCSMAGIISSKGQANQLDHPANRFYREALVYSVSGQTIPVLTNSISLLLDRASQHFSR